MMIWIPGAAGMMTVMVLMVTIIIMRAMADGEILVVITLWLRCQMMMWWLWPMVIPITKTIVNCRDKDNCKTIPHICHFFLHAHIFSHKNFTLGKCVNLRQNCPATKQRKSPPQTYISNWTNYTLSVKFYTDCKILHWVQHYTLSVKLHTKCKIPTKCKITHLV